MWAEFFVLWTFPFWMLVFVEVCVLFWFVEDEWPARALTSLIVFALILIFLGNFNVFKYIKANPMLILKYFGMYLGIGLLWAVAKYYFFLTNIRRKYAASKDKYMKTHGITDMTPTNLKDWKNGWGMADEKKLFTKDTEFLKNKVRILTWWTYWPLSMIWTLVSDFVKRVIEELWELFKKFFEMMRTKILGELLRDQAKM